MARVYTARQGVCIEFDDEFFSDSNVTKLECVYEFNAKRSLLENGGSLLLNQEKLQSFHNSFQAIEAYVKTIVSALPQLKHYSFRPEKETRWGKSADGAADSRVPISYRPHRLGLATYTAVDLNLDAVKSVTLGPQVEKQNEKTVEDFLLVNECGGFVTRSMSTLR